MPSPGAPPREAAPLWERALQTHLADMLAVVLLLASCASRAYIVYEMAA